jgi:hypothetical protein
LHAGATSSPSSSGCILHMPACGAPVPQGTGLRPPVRSLGVTAHTERSRHNCLLTPNTSPNSAPNTTRNRNMQTCRAERSAQSGGPSGCPKAVGMSFNRRRRSDAHRPVHAHCGWFRCPARCAASLVPTCLCTCVRGAHAQGPTLNSIKTSAK